MDAESVPATTISMGMFLTTYLRGGGVAAAASRGGGLQGSPSGSADGFWLRNLGRAAMQAPSVICGRLSCPRFLNAGQRV